MTAKSNNRRVTKAYDVLDAQDVLRKMNNERINVRGVYIGITGYIMVAFDTGPVRYAGRLSTEVKDWLSGASATVYEWNVTGGEVFAHEKAEPRLFGLNLCIVPQGDANGQTETPDTKAHQG